MVALIDRKLPFSYSTQISIVEKNEARNTSIEIGFLENSRNREKAIEIILDGGVVAAQMGSVFGMWINADNPESVAKVAEIKKINKALSIMMPSQRLIDIADKELIHPSIRDLYEDSQKLSKLVGAICHLRTPIKRNFADGFFSNGTKIIPQSILSSDAEQKIQYVHSLDPLGHNGINTWINEILSSGVRFVGVTSLNSTGTAEIYDIKQAIRFCRQQPQIPMLLLDDNHNPEVKGSFAIVDTKKGNYVRDGRIPMHVIDAILGINLSENSHEAKQHKFHQYDFRDVLSQGYQSEELRSEVLRIAYSRNYA